MREDELRQLIRDADADVGASPPPSDLAQRVIREAARRRRRLYGTLSAAAAAIILAAGGYFTLRPAPSSTPGPAMVNEETGDDVELASLRREIELIEQETALRQLALEETRRVVEQQRKLAKLKQTPMPDTVANVNRQADKAAGELVAQADRLCLTLKKCDSAAVKYRRVVKLFPDSSWARVARQRLAEIEKTGEA